MEKQLVFFCSSVEYDTPVCWSRETAEYSHAHTAENSVKCRPRGVLAIFRVCFVALTIAAGLQGSLVYLKPGSVVINACLSTIHYQQYACWYVWESPAHAQL